MSRYVIGEMFMIWIAWKVMDTVLKWIVMALPVPQGLRDVVVGG